MFAWELLKEIKVTNSTFKSSEQPPEDTCQTVKGIHVQIGYKLESIRATTAGVNFSKYSPTTENLSARGAIPSRRQFKF